MKKYVNTVVNKGRSKMNGIYIQAVDFWPQEFMMRHQAHDFAVILAKHIRTRSKIRTFLPKVV